MIKISIPEPCNENWENMLPSEKGKFCLSCHKEVIDFSVMTKNEITQYFKGLPQNTCGRFGAKQLAEINAPTQIKPLIVFKPWWLVASLLILSKNVVSQTGNSNVDCERQHIEINKITPLNPKKVTTVTKTNEIIIKGVVTDKKTGETIPFANVVIDELYIGTSTDFDGCFTLKVPQTSLVSLKLEVRFLGYENYDTIIDLTEKDLLIELELGEIKLGGAVVIQTVGGISYERPSVWRRIGYFFRRIF